MFSSSIVVSEMQPWETPDPAPEPDMVLLGDAVGLAEESANTALTAAWAILSTLSMAAGAYHGYRRNDSVGWALWWGLMGATFPVITPTIALAQGFGKRKR